MTVNSAWTPVATRSPDEFAGARVELHWAAQVLGAAADALLPHAEDDSHTNLHWNREYDGLIGTIAEPYFYVTPCPIDEGAELPSLEAGGHWHTEGFTGALLLASRLVDVDPKQQRGRVESYLRSAIGTSESLIRATATGQGCVQ